MRVSLVQRRCLLGDREGNIESIGRHVRSTDADLHVFCEMATTGYALGDDIVLYAEAEGGRSFEALSAIAVEGSTHVLVGMPVRVSAGIVANSAVMFRPDGSWERYDKIHLANFGPFQEGLWFRSGRDVVVMDVEGVRVGVVICYDLFFPETVVECAELGADLVVCLSASPCTSRGSFDAVIPARAVESTVYLAYVNQVGVQGDFVFFGGSRAIDPFGREVARCPTYDEGVAVLDVDRSIIGRARASRPTLRDRGSAP